MRLAWVTDPHLEWINETLDRFLDELAHSKTEGVIISGDISFSKKIKYYLRRLSELPMPVYFVLGNHDIYDSNFEQVYQTVRKSVKDYQNIMWLTEAPPIQLTEDTYLIGHDGWADGRAGIGSNSGFLINDYRLIHDFSGMSINEVFNMMRERADVASVRLNNQIRSIGKKHIIVVTHAPPFMQACLYNGRVSDENYLPHFSNIGLGQTLEAITNEVGASITVLCGHTHEEANISINNRITVRVGKALYGRPSFTTLDADLGH